MTLIYMDGFEAPVAEIEPKYPTFTFSETFFPTVHVTRWMLEGYRCEAKPPMSQWLGGFKLRYYGYESKKLWDHRELLGLGENENEFLETFDHRKCLQVVVPARRYAGLNAYELQKLYYLKMPKAGDWSQQIFRHETEGRYVRHRDGHVMYLDDFPPGATITYTVKSNFRMVNPYEERASERRARHSSTMDGNGKPRRRK